MNAILFLTFLFLKLGEVVDCEVRQLDAQTGKVVITHEAFPSNGDAKLLEHLQNSDDGDL